MKEMEKQVEIRVRNVAMKKRGLKRRSEREKKKNMKLSVFLLQMGNPSNPFSFFNFGTKPNLYFDFFFFFILFSFLCLSSFPIITLHINQFNLTKTFIHITIMHSNTLLNLIKSLFLFNSTIYSCFFKKKW